MRRFILPIFAGLVLVTASTACDAKEQPPTTAPSTAAAAPAGSSVAAPTGDDKVACATATSARTSVLNDLILALLTVGDEESTPADVDQAAKDLAKAYTVLADGLDKAADQAATPALKEALNDYADGSRAVLAKVKAAGTDRVQLDAATDDPDLNTAERTSMESCD